MKERTLYIGPATGFYGYDSFKESISSSEGFALDLEDTRDNDTYGIFQIYCISFKACLIYSNKISKENPPREAKVTLFCKPEDRADIEGIIAKAKIKYESNNRLKNDKLENVI
ncbi:MAG: hypothetical protein ABH824_03575 [Nanoarchaeota archaeon]|nr:hypothetical protein [Nanoarchaeota archaeon]MBU1632388.1 hypothetical protein [Nanoarchaeota archaeon]MBU1876692.1 hypothetical protein [Nanoarchaeota archaeon]